MVATAAAAKTAEAEVTPKILQSLQQMEHTALLPAAPPERQELHIIMGQQTPHKQQTKKQVSAQFKENLFKLLMIQRLQLLALVATMAGAG